MHGGGGEGRLIFLLVYFHAAALLHNSKAVIAEGVTSKTEVIDRSVISF